MLHAHNAAPNLTVSPIHGQMPTSELGMSHPQNRVVTRTKGTIRGRFTAVGLFITKVFGDVEDMQIIDAMFCEKTRYKAEKG